MNRVLLGVILFFAGFSGKAQTLLPYKNPALPVAQRVNDLLQRMTTEEKFWQLFMIPGELDSSKPELFAKGIFGLQISATTQNAKASEQKIGYNTTEDFRLLARKINATQAYFVQKTRLGIPIIPFDEALHGLVRRGATAFPQSIALAATFDSSLVRSVAQAIASEARRLGIRQVLSPVINIATDPRWGRTEETYGEDPYLSSCMAYAYVSAFEQAGIITTPKHFLANVGDGGRDSYPIHANERYLREIHLPPFEAALKAGARSIMTSYNSLDGSPATANSWLLNQWLKKEQAFTGFVISDAGAVGGANVLHFTASNYADATQKAILSGLDVIFQTQHAHHTLFLPPFLNDSIPQKRLDEAVARVLRAKFELGLFEHPYVEEVPTEDIPSEHRRLAKLSAEKSFVLLQNQRSTLPLKGKSIRNLLVLGQDAIEARMGGYSGPGNQVVSIFQGLQKALPNAKVDYQKGVDREDSSWQLFPGKFHFVDSTCRQPGLKGRYSKQIAFPFSADAERIDPNIQFSWTLFGPDNLGVNSFYAVEWSGYIRTDSTAEYEIALEGNDGYRLYFDDRLLMDRWSKQSYHRTRARILLEKGKAYRLRVEFFEPTGNGRIKLLYRAQQAERQVEQIQQACSAAKNADAVVVVAGISEGEFLDRASLRLPGQQENLIHALAETGKPMVVLLVAGSAVNMASWMDKAGAIAQIWYSGEAGGEAVADMLLGKTNPSGRMPFSTPIEESQLPLVYNHKPTGRGDDYQDLSGQSLFPFGFGLSYTQFSYSALHAPEKVKRGEPIQIRFTVRNIGRCRGEEVVQLYCRDVVASVARPVMELIGFQRIALEAGESREATFSISAEELKMLNMGLERVQEAGQHVFMLGSSSRDIRLQSVVEVK